MSNKPHSLITIYFILTMCFVANIIVALPVMYSMRLRNYEDGKTRDSTSSDLLKKQLERKPNTISAYATNYRSLSTSKYTINIIKAAQSTNNTMFSITPSEWTIPSSSRRSTTIDQSNKENNDNFVLITVGIVFGGVVGLYFLYLLLLLNVVFWKFVFRKFNCHNYAEIIE